MDRYNQGFRDGERDFDEMHKVRRILLAVLKQLLYKEWIKWTKSLKMRKNGQKSRGMYWRTMHMGKRKDPMESSGLPFYMYLK